MPTPAVSPIVKHAILTLADIQERIAEFDRGEANLFDALDAIAVILEAYRSAREPRREAA